MDLALAKAGLRKLDRVEIISAKAGNEWTIGKKGIIRKAYGSDTCVVEFDNGLGHQSIQINRLRRIDPSDPRPEDEVMTGIEATLAQRESQYGSFTDHAKITQAIKRAMEDSKNWDSLPDDMRESLEMVAHKIGRILNGDPNFHDSWHDIIGYVRLVEERLEPKQ